MTSPAVDLESLSDEDFLNQAEALANGASSVDPDAVVPVEDPVEESTVVVVADAPVVDAEAGAEVEAEEAPAADPGAAPAVAAVEDHTTPKQPEPAVAGEADAAAEAPNYEALYKQVMGTFKANGRDFTPTSPEEAVRLMQMGANYTKKMQALKPNLKLLRMLENNGLLAEDQITHLIDLKKGDKAAIQKLLTDGKVDPLDLDAFAETTYKPGSHSVSDDEMAFNEVLENVLETPTGTDTVRTINGDWDEASKKELFKDPTILAAIHIQRSNGVYAKITSEIDRRKVLGQFANTRFIDAYKAVGDELHMQGKLLPPSAQTAPAAVTASNPQSAANLGTRSTRAAKQAPATTQVAALARAPGSGAVAKKAFDPLNMTDAEIMALPATI